MSTEIIARQIAKLIQFDRDGTEDPRWVEANWHRFREDAEEFETALRTTRKQDDPFRIDSLKIERDQRWVPEGGGADCLVLRVFVGDRGPQVRYQKAGGAPRSCSTGNFIGWIIDKKAKLT